jgi:hypothetical protein
LIVDPYIGSKAKKDQQLNTNIIDLLAPLAHPEHLVQDGLPLKVSVG